jgi:hypothetical protein
MSVLRFWGNLIYRILVRIKAKEEDGLLLYRVFHEQYTVEKGKAVLRDKKQVSAGSVQNPNDPDAGYRIKGDQKVKGYGVNITETNDKDGKPSIITDVRVKPAGAADNDYLQDATKKSEDVSGTQVSHINADGAYQSRSNRDFARDNHIELVTTGLQGRQSRFDLTPANGTLTVTDRTTGETRPVTRTKREMADNSGRLQGQVQIFYQGPDRRGDAQEETSGHTERRTRQAQQCRGGNVPGQLPYTQRQDPLQGTCQAHYVGRCQMYVDELRQTGDFPEKNVSKNYS